MPFSVTVTSLQHEDLVLDTIDRGQDTPKDGFYVSRPHLAPLLLQHYGLLSTESPHIGLYAIILPNMTGLVLKYAPTKRAVFCQGVGQCYSVKAITSCWFARWRLALRASF